MTYTTRRLIALAAAMVTKLPVTASTNATTAVAMIALDGVRKREWILPNQGGRSPCSASANRLRDPDSACPMLLPDVDNTAPMVIINAPAAPMNVAAESASGVFDWAMPGSVPNATTWVSRVMAATMMMVMIRAKGMALRGSLVSPPRTGTTSYPPNAKIRMSAPVESCWTVIVAGAPNEPQSTYAMPMRTNTTSGSTFATVSTLTTRLLWRMPRMLIPAISAMIAARRSGRAAAPSSTGQ